MEACASTNTRDTSTRGVTPLICAAAGGHVESVSLLLENEVDPDTGTLDSGMTPLVFAAANGHIEVVQLLLDGRSDVDRTTRR